MAKQLYCFVRNFARDWESGLKHYTSIVIKSLISELSNLAVLKTKKAFKPMRGTFHNNIMEHDHIIIEIGHSQVVTVETDANILSFYYYYYYYYYYCECEPSQNRCRKRDRE